MPSRPEHRGFYPIDWPQLSHVIRFDRAGGRCERCARPHGERIWHLGDRFTAAMWVYGGTVTKSAGEMRRGEQCACLRSASYTMLRYAKGGCGAVWYLTSAWWPPQDCDGLLWCWLAATSTTIPSTTHRRTSPRSASVAI